MSNLAIPANMCSVAMDCAICLEKIEELASSPGCVHKFCVPCLDEWMEQDPAIDDDWGQHLKEQKSCPVCRHPINLVFVVIEPPPPPPPPPPTPVEEQRPIQGQQVGQSDYRTCDICGKKFNNSSAKCQHRRTHNPPVHCEGCGVAFKSETYLRVHRLRCSH